MAGLDTLATWAEALGLGRWSIAASSALALAVTVLLVVGTRFGVAGAFPLMVGLFLLFLVCFGLWGWARRLLTGSDADGADPAPARGDEAP